MADTSLNENRLGILIWQTSNVWQSNLRKLLKDYEQEHLDLDQILIQLQEKHTVDFLQIQRLKKRKLSLKDKIIELRNKIEPDIIA